MRLDELCPRDRAACLRAQECNQFDDFDTQAADRNVRIIGRLHGPTPLAADNRDPTTYLWAACFGPENLPRIVREETREVDRDTIRGSRLSRAQTVWATDAKARYENAVSRAKYFELAHPLRQILVLKSKNAEIECFHAKEQSGRYLYFIVCFQ
jgi:hypothetical protein